MRTREPLQIGAELYGHAGVESDVEIQALMVNALRAAGVAELHVDLGHVGGVPLPDAALPGRRRARVRAVPGAADRRTCRRLRELVAACSDASCAQALLLLPELYGGAEVLAAGAPARCRRIRSSPRRSTRWSASRAICATVVHVHCFDLAELRGYHYHSGVVFAAYTRGRPNAIALGGRYDEVGKAFGRARPATGFSMDLRELAGLCAPAPRRERGSSRRIAPDDADPARAHRRAARAGRDRDRRPAGARRHARRAGLHAHAHAARTAGGR